jgi:hypothetical protein
MLCGCSHPEKPRPYGEKSRKGAYPDFYFPE